jgi:hypothetical protein
MGAISALLFIMVHRLEGLKKLAKDYETHAQELDKQTKAIIAESDEHFLFIAIGSALTTWSKLEEGLVHILAILLRSDTEKSGLILYSIINFNVWISVIDEIFAIDDTLTPLKPRWNKIAARLRELKDGRDRLAHNAVRYDDVIADFGDTAIRPGRLDIRRKSVKSAPMNRDDISAFSRRVNQTTQDMIDLGREMLATLRASREKSSE